MTDTFKLTTFVSLYQAGEGIYDQFDKVLLIDEGRQVFFGPAKDARPYMLFLYAAAKASGVEGTSDSDLPSANARSLGSVHPVR